jgi:hypothetical protein
MTDAELERIERDARAVAKARALATPGPWSTWHTTSSTAPPPGHGVAIVTGDSMSLIHHLPTAEDDAFAAAARNHPTEADVLALVAEVRRLGGTTGREVAAG